MKMGLQGKLISLCVGLSMVTLVVGSIGYYGIGALSEGDNHLTEITMPKNMLLGDMLAEYRKVRINVRTLGLVNVDEKTAREAIRNVGEAITAFEEAEAKFDHIVNQPGGATARAEFEAVKAEWKTFKTIGQQAVAYYETKKPEDHQKMMSIFLKDCPESAARFTAAINKTLAVQKAKAEETAKQLESLATRSKFMGVLGMILGFVLSAGAGFLFSRALSRQLAEMAENLSQGARQLSAAATQISATSQTLSANATEQASSIEETSASLQELGGMVENNLKNAEEGVHISELGQKSAEKGTESMRELVESMKEILESNKRIEGLVKVIEEIGEKTAVIDEIVFQTKLLSFNASVEAERAGEHGRGFAVVAQEVGNLAQMSGKAATEISGIVKASVKDAQTIATENRERVAKGNTMVLATAEVLKEIRSNTESIMSGSSQIVKASREQATGIRQINKAMDTLNQTTQQTAAHSEEAAGAGEELSAQADSVNQVVGELNYLIFGEAVRQSRGPRMPASAGNHAPGGTARPTAGKVAYLDAKRVAKAPAPMSQPLKKAAGSEQVWEDPSAPGSDWDKL